MIFSLKSIFIFLVSLSSILHPVHVSITNVDYIKDQKRAEIVIKVFKEDFQLLFAHLYQVNLDVDNIENDLSSQEQINTYFSNNFKLKFDNKENQILKYKGLKKNDESIWFMYEIEVSTEPNSIEFTNTILLDLYFDQKNMLIFSYNDIEKGFLFNLKRINKIFEFHDF
ncbi:MAG: hypothetical protein PF485_04205 [Bacteroidales bacterium]|jgi:hypothetical protein|nr:hypothetical protein [Bacteroidales bacterium]